tara:strand:- start:113 stop:418 length:306 start_codon:yes stop_codon:yes gene_type:complete
MVKKYSLAVIKEAVDTATGDDGLRSEEVVELLDKEIIADPIDIDKDEAWIPEDEVKVHDSKADILKLIDKVDELEQKIVNIDAKFDRKLDLMRKDIEGGKK